MPTSIVSIIGDISVLPLPMVQVTFIKDCLSWDRKALTHALVWIPRWDHNGIPSRPLLSIVQDTHRVSSGRN